jgi:ribosomal protein S18 acetylase RimI-like enzyme
MRRASLLLRIVLCSIFLGSSVGFVALQDRRQRQCLPCTPCHLFFHKAQQTLQKKPSRTKRIPSWVLETLTLPDTTLPMQFQLETRKTIQQQQQQEADEESSSSSSVVTIRWLTVDDLTRIVPMCVSEFGGKPGEDSLEYLVQNFPSWHAGPQKMTRFVREWFENAALPWLIYTTFLLKILMAQHQQQQHNKNNQYPQDHALLVATLQQPPLPQGNGSHNNNHNQNNKNEVLVGMVELSQQPPDPYRIPTAYPLPLWYKQATCRLPVPNNKKLLEPQRLLNGWVTNLLIDPQYRSQGYSKLLMAAVEGIAKTWECTAIYLHCDADPGSGKIPQRLYTGLGYEMVQDPLESSPSWISGSQSFFSNNIFIIQGVALLFLQKNLLD